MFLLCLLASISGLTGWPVANSYPGDCDLPGVLFQAFTDGYVFPISLEDSSEKLRKTFNKRKPLKVITHGLAQSIRSDELQNVSRAYAHRGGTHVIAVGWEHLASLKCINGSDSLGNFIIVVGAKVRDMVERLVSIGVASLGTTHLIGHSLGAHVMGVAGKGRGGKVARITGLDPSTIGLVPLPRLNRDRAVFVDVIHTSIISKHWTIIGHADFYPNGGKQQQDCSENRSIRKIIECEHSRAWELYIESINYPNNFKSVQCDTWNSFIFGRCNYNQVKVMGAETPNNTRGAYYLRTNAKPPYGNTHTHKWIPTV